MSNHDEREEANQQHLEGFAHGIQVALFPGWGHTLGKTRKRRRRRMFRRLRHSSTRTTVQYWLPGFHLQAAMFPVLDREPKARIGHMYARRRKPLSRKAGQPSLPNLGPEENELNLRKLEREKEKARKQRMRYIPLRKRRDVLRRDNYLCVYCGANLHEVPVEIDHRVPVSMMGNNQIDNLQSTCRTCNRRKRNYSDGAELRERLELRQRQDALTKQMDFFDALRES